MLIKEEKFKRALVGKAKRLLRNIDEGYISPSAYDTAWVARIPSEEDPSRPMFPECLRWLQVHQIADGSWGAKGIEYYHDRIICTLSSIIALKTWNVSPRRIKRGEEYISANLENLRNDARATVGFEIIFPALLKTARFLGIKLRYDSLIIQEIEMARELKLKMIPVAYIYSGQTTLLHSLEGLEGLLDYKKILVQQSENGSFLNSPSSTAFMFLKTKNQAALAYIKGTLKKFKNALPVNYPIDIFARLWVLSEIYYLKIEKYLQNDIDEAVQYLKKYWNNDRGIGWSKFVNIPDLDDTAVAIKIFSKNNVDVNHEVIRKFIDGDRIYCFRGEMESSPSHIAHLLEAIQEVGYNDKEVEEKIFRRLLKFQEEGKLFHDKWHVSPYYPAMLILKVFGENKVLNRPMLKYDPFWINIERILLNKVLVDKSFVEQIFNPRIMKNTYCWIDKCLYATSSLFSHY